MNSEMEEYQNQLNNNSSQLTWRSRTRVNYGLLNDPYSHNSRSTLSRSVECGIDEDRAFDQLYITEEDIYDEFRQDNIPLRDMLLYCVENLYLCIYVHGEKTLLRTHGQQSIRIF